MKLSKGSVVWATAGKDSGKLFAVTDIQGGYCFIVDGRSRKLASHKRKNIKHICPTDSMIDINDITDKKLRTLLRQLAVKE
ncbi:MAG: KOW domain-containing RNA-binding protein [Ruminococcus flavefaciens]|nr:KOW domain-containing RNA-binding protein [Ruminococcus flavefaciens]